MLPPDSKSDNNTSKESNNNDSLEVVAKSVIVFFANSLKRVLKKCLSILNILKEEITRELEKFSAYEDFIYEENLGLDMDVEINKIARINFVFKIMRDIRFLIIFVKRKISRISYFYKNNDLTKALKSIRINLFKVYWLFFNIMSDYKRLIAADGFIQ
jgi:hypothetical protein